MFSQQLNMKKKKFTSLFFLSHLPLDEMSFYIGVFILCQEVYMETATNKTIIKSTNIFDQFCPSHQIKSPFFVFNWYPTGLGMILHYSVTKHAVSKGNTQYNKIRKILSASDCILASTFMNHSQLKYYIQAADKVL